MPETHRANSWLSEAFLETQTSSGTNLFGVFSCVGSFGDRVDSICSNSTCKVCWRGRILCAPLNSMVCALFFYALCSIISCFHVLDYWHKTSATRSHTIAECTRNWGSKFQCNFSAEQVRWAATEWLDKGSWLLVWVWVVYGGLKVSDFITGSVYHVSGPASSLFLSLKGNEKSATGPPIGCQVAPSYPVVHLLKVVSVVCGPRICNPWQNEVGPALEKARQCN